MSLAERVAVARFHKPAVLSIRCRPEHEIGRDLTSNFGPVSRKRPFRPNTDHELDLIGQGERLLEQKIGAPLCLTTAKQRRDAPLYFQPILDGGKFYGGRRAETGTAG